MSFDSDKIEKSEARCKPAESTFDVPTKSNDTIYPLIEGITVPDFPKRSCFENVQNSDRFLKLPQRLYLSA